MPFHKAHSLLRQLFRGGGSFPSRLCPLFRGLFRRLPRLFGVLLFQLLLVPVAGDNVLHGLGDGMPAHHQHPGAAEQVAANVDAALVLLGNRVIEEKGQEQGRADGRKARIVNRPAILRGNLRVFRVAAIFANPASSLARDDFIAAALAGAHQRDLVYAVVLDGLHEPFHFRIVPHPKGMVFEREQLRKIEIDNLFLFGAGRVTGLGRRFRRRLGSGGGLFLALYRGGLSALALEHFVSKWGRGLVCYFPVSFSSPPLFRIVTFLPILYANVIIPNAYLSTYFVPFANFFIDFYL